LKSFYSNGLGFSLRREAKEFSEHDEVLSCLIYYTHTDHCGGGKDRTKLGSWARRGGSLLGLGSRPVARGLLEGVLVRKLGIGLLQPRQLHFHEGGVGGTTLLGLLAGLLRGHCVLGWMWSAASPVKKLK